MRGVKGRRREEGEGEYLNERRPRVELGEDAGIFRISKINFRIFFNELIGERGGRGRIRSCLA